MRIILIIPELSSGGAERVLVLLAKGFLQRDHSVSVLTMSNDDADFYSLPTGVKRIALNLRYKSATPLHALWNTVVRLVCLRKAIQSTQPDVVISFMPQMNILTALALFRTNYAVIATQHSSAKMFPCGQPWELLRHATYPQLQKVVSVSQDVDDEFSWLPKGKRAVISNPFLPIKRTHVQIDYPNKVDPDKKWIVAMGRLINAKGFDLLLAAFEKIADRYPDWDLLILGEGELKLELENLRDRLKLSESVVFTGAISNPFPLLQRAKLFVLASRTEGFPMALGEALACGLPVISTNCSSGIREVMRDGIDGILVPNQDVGALAAAMDRLMSDEAERNRLATRAPEVVERFSLDKVLDRWETLIVEVLQNTHN
ncbi:glycosyltransferase family 4 protein (plasmid) [Nostoc sp. C052]|uniref:glycosyltransferase family 4 protein n=1 Tax=Nostoc sp. C052 TaxID=2576902 RepID=UPI0015C3303D|nr:glycosyltransferase family 4 protein [Nostoc sp. C052]QLE45994.1 glycosyltransferase family 4 protein [Nostoc sp. C052]